MADFSYLNYEGVAGNVVNPYQQQYNDTCAIKSQQLILNEYGIPVTEDQLVQYSAEHGWYNGDGTAMGDVGRLLLDAGIPCTSTVNANVYDLIDQLSNGHKVIVAVDSGELWDNGILDWLKDIFFGDTPDHALIVAGIDMTDPNNPMVILTDPGTGQPAAPYPLDQFMDAWGDSQNFMVSTDIPTPAAMSQFEMAGMTDMHLPEIAGVDYTTFQQFQELSHLVDPSQIALVNTAFDSFASVPGADFNSMMSGFGLPTLDVPFVPPFPEYDPLTFDYSGFNTDIWSGSDPVVDTTSDYTEHRRELLEGLLHDAQQHAQDCLDNGMYISATTWQQQINDLQHDLNNL